MAVGANAAGAQVAVARLEVVRVAADGGLGADAGELREADYFQSP